MGEALKLGVISLLEPGEMLKIGLLVEPEAPAAPREPHPFSDGYSEFS